MSEDTFKKIRFYERQLIINKEVQWSLIAYSVFLVVVVLICQTLLQTFETQSASTAWIVENPDLYRVLVFLLVFALFLGIIIYGFFITNKIVGPVYRLKIHMENVLEGKERNDLDFRKGDFFRDLIVPYNNIIKAIKKKS